MIIKVCGTRDPQNIQQITTLGVDMIGFIFYHKSIRYADPSRFLVTEKVKRVGVFVNASQEEMMNTATLFKLDYLQLHGNESPEICHALQKRGFALIKTFSVASTTDLEQATAYEGRADYFLFDTKCEAYGGSGRNFDWSVLANYTGKTPFLLSGGISIIKLEDIRNFNHPSFAGIDLNSRFEIEPGIKDIKLLDNFIKALNNQ